MALNFLSLGIHIAVLIHPLFSAPAMDAAKMLCDAAGKFYPDLRLLRNLLGFC